MGKPSIIFRGNFIKKPFVTLLCLNYNSIMYRFSDQEVAMKKGKHKLLTISILITLTSAAIFIINKLIAASAVVKNLLHSREENYYNWRFGKIHYTKQGSGSPLLLIHDLNPYGNLHEWKAVAEELAKKHTVYCIDLLGCGCSDRPKITYTNFLYVQLITDFIKTVIKEKTDVITSGLSGSFTVMACRNDDAIINKIMMVNPTDLAVLNQIPTKQSKIAKFLLELPLVGTLVYNVIVSKGNVDLLFTEQLVYNPFHVDTELVDTCYESAHLEKGNGKYLLSSIAGKYIYCSIAATLKEINNSIYIIGGQAEKGIQETVALYTSMNFSIESEIFSHTKHLPHLEAPRQFLATADIFF